MRAYATGRLPYLTDEDAWSTWRGRANFVGMVVAVPLWRNLHFYFAHRLSHCRFAYKYFHSVHHRNTDTEPFSGLCMHPIEHLYYFTSVAPSLYLFASPFAFLWNGVHCVISPAGSHSGFEDHVASDLHHYLHHRFFECNFGTPLFPLDRFFGTNKLRLDPKEEVAGTAAEGATVGMMTDAKATLLGLPDPGAAAYALLAVILPACTLGLAAQRSTAGPLGTYDLPHAGPVPVASLVAALVSCGPIAASMLLLLCAHPKQALAKPRFAFLAPFHRDALLGWGGFHLAVGAALTVVPVYHAVEMALGERGQSAYCAIYGAAACEPPQPVGLLAWLNPFRA